MTDEEMAEFLEQEAEFSPAMELLTVWKKVAAMSELT